jgi:hypothetical protein
VGRHNKYEGPFSCYAKREGVYVPGNGVNRYTAPAIAALILYDLYRGYGYDSRCERIKMTPMLADKRLRYLIPLARKHAPQDLPYVERLVHYVRRTGKLPPVPIRLAGLESRIRAIKETLARAGILPVATVTTRARARRRAAVGV